MKPLLRCCVLAVCSAAFANLAVAQDMPLSDLLIPGEEWKQVAAGFKFTEGPAVASNGNLYFTDIPNNKILRLTADGKVGVFLDKSMATNGLMFGPDNRLYGCQNGAKRIVAWERNGTAHVIAEGVESNDLVVTRDKTVYFTDPLHQQVWRVGADGKKQVVDKGIARPNGIILWPDQGTLVVADSAGPHLWTFRVEADGGLAHKQPYYTMLTPSHTSASGADGMTVDAAGRLYVTTRLGLQVFDPAGRLSGIIAKPQAGPLSNVVFAGPDLGTLYVTAGDKVFARKLKAKGVR